jgi:hypothetical protein
MRGALLLVAIAACGKGDKLQWREQKLKAITAGPYTLPIPPGWRDTSESTMPALAKITDSLGPDGHVIVLEDATNTDTNIGIMWSDLSAAAAVLSCDQFGDNMIAAGLQIDKQNITQLKLGPDQGCVFNVRQDDTTGTMYARFHGDHFLTVQCSHVKPDKRLDDACDQLTAILKK